MAQLYNQNSQQSDIMTWLNFTTKTASKATSRHGSTLQPKQPAKRHHDMAQLYNQRCHQNIATNQPHNIHAIPSPTDVSTTNVRPILSKPTNQSHNTDYSFPHKHISHKHRKERSKLLMHPPAPCVICRRSSTTSARSRDQPL